eukprot:NODE_502_length_2983_cov_2.617997.p5 GENE.NODE_502_length_2983_cov_2.617997~~NODE_502_length_2983_cov_2.617997.p5  ORF type:complete len:211 (-),score=36.74 NODE_502_length_2983_cov_2.617997:1583-2215(-)
MPMTIARHAVPLQCVSTAWALATFHLQFPPVRDTGGALPSRVALHSFGPQALQVIVWAVAALQWSSPLPRGHAARAHTLAPGEYSPPNVAGTVWSLCAAASTGESPRACARWPPVQRQHGYEGIWDNLATTVWSLCVPESPREHRAMAARVNPVRGACGLVQPSLVNTAWAWSCMQPFRRVPSYAASVPCGGSSIRWGTLAVTMSSWSLA